MVSERLEVKKKWHKCARCGVFSDPDEEFCCSDRHNGTPLIVFYSYRQIRENPGLLEKVRTKHWDALMPGPNGHEP